MSKLKFILSGGGTGGHIYPAVAIADELKKRHPDAEFLFVGAKDRMEMQKIPEAGYPIEGLWIAGLHRKLTFDNLLFPVKLLSSLMKSKKIIKNFQPDAVIGTGGFASAPLLKAAQQKNIPNLIQEQNSYAGITNKWLAEKASKICVAYENMEKYFPVEKIKLTGNPVRKDLVELTNKEEALKFFGFNKDKKTILILGGSLGAKKINESIEQYLGFLKAQNLQVLWQCGKLYVERFAKYDDQKQVQVHQFINRMDMAYAAADVIISRSGAISVSELCIVGKPVIFIPSPNVAEDHQTKNAQALAEKNAAIVLKESEIGQQFEKTLLELLQNKDKVENLSKNIKKLAKPEATQVIVDEIEKLLKA